MKTIQLTQNQVAIIDDEDFERVNQYKWTAQKIKNNWYAKIHIGEKTIFLHRFIENVTDTKTQIDHKDRDGLNCQKYNMRICTNLQNSWNNPGKRNHKSGYKGVYHQKKTNKWRARITFNGEHIHIGYFYDIKEAALAYDNKAIELFGEFAYTNF